MRIQLLTINKLKVKCHTRRTLKGGAILVLNVGTSIEKYSSMSFSFFSNYLERGEGGGEGRRERGREGGGRAKGEGRKRRIKGRQ